MKKKILVISALLVVLLGFIYIPQFFIKDAENKYPESINKSVLNNYKDYIELLSEEDFDNDGLLNKTELDIGSNPYFPDTDKDGLSDYYEYISGTDVCSFDNVLLDNMKSDLKQSDLSYQNPYNSNGLILWADDLYSRTYGNVILSQAGKYIAYVFDEFNGYVQFPEGKIPYDISTGYHIKLDFDEENNLYIVKSGMKVLLYDSELEYMYKTSFFDNVSYKKETFINDIINVILPSKGVITSNKIVIEDTKLDANNGLSLTNIPIADKDYDYTQFSRFKYNNTKLSDLADVYSNINKGYSVAVSLIDNNGETLGIVYGYDKYGNLLLANIENGEKLGTIYITEQYSKLYTDKNKYTDYYWYSFKGLGYDSDKNARISFYASSIVTSE